MFSTLDTTWDRSARRKWTTLASFTMQALALSLLLAISLIWTGGPPRVRWLQISAPATFTESTPSQPEHARHSMASASTRTHPMIIAPSTIPREIAPVTAVNDVGSIPAAPDLAGIGIGEGGGSEYPIPGAIGDGLTIAIPPRPMSVKPLVVSHLAEANLLHRVQPVYPALARQARLQGTVELRAVISKTGTIENLIVVHGHPMLAGAAIDAVRQWRYRPYLLNGEPVEVETEITVNFLLSGG